MIEENKHITIAEISAGIKRGITATKSRIGRLKKTGYIVRVGSNRGGLWMKRE